ncbi:helix-turn-helix domain-containing protein [Anaerocolumna xylanovorans]|uniref:AraC-type DNA-binding protein n=1 Tax=Anaerocolumna xylanovorans DSM 12503 TaxID=1121345 RepID=A0A1M7XXD3_9FIRM|nr:AraC family transcriptional regulator [Anaerocolumna xylanovorans]SHO43411.1 AraC-type DNA-binding protein [Anaerocolumna xylanovorans DSM 12503]
MEKGNSLKKIKTYIDSHLQEELDLNKLAKEAGYSKYHLERLFTKHYGCTLTKYIREERLKAAAIQLAFTNASILEIALGACYESQQAFTLAFKRLYQVAPGSYRNNIKKALSCASFGTVLSAGTKRRLAA